MYVCTCGVTQHNEPPLVAVASLNFAQETACLGHQVVCPVGLVVVYTALDVLLWQQTMRCLIFRVCFVEFLLHLGCYLDCAHHQLRTDPYLHCSVCVCAWHVCVQLGLCVGNCCADLLAVVTRESSVCRVCGSFADQTHEQVM